MAHLNLCFAYYFKCDPEGDLALAQASFACAIQVDASCHPTYFGFGLVYLADGIDQVYSQYEILVQMGSNYAPELMGAVIEYNKMVTVTGQAVERSR